MGLFTWPHPYQHDWWPAVAHGVPHDRCRLCGVIRRMDGKSDKGVCSPAVGANLHFGVLDEEKLRRKPAS